MIPWQVASGSPTRLVLLMDMIWSPMLSLPERAAGPPFIMLAKITVGRMEPQPDSTMTTPRISPLLFSSCSCGERGGDSLFLHVQKLTQTFQHYCVVICFSPFTLMKRSQNQKHSSLSISVLQSFSPSGICWTEKPVIQLQIAEECTENSFSFKII